MKSQFPLNKRVKTQSRTAEQWRAYHLEYYRTHAERRRQQKKASHQRMKLVRAYARYGGLVPDRVIRLLFLRDSQSKRN